MHKIIFQIHVEGNCEKVLYHVSSTKATMEVLFMHSIYDGTFIVWKNAQCVTEHRQKCNLRHTPSFRRVLNHFYIFQNFVRYLVK